jgi:hypothetical protein
MTVLEGESIMSGNSREVIDEDHVAGWTGRSHGTDKNKLEVPDIRNDSNLRTLQIQFSSVGKEGQSPN